MRKTAFHNRMRFHGESSMNSTIKLVTYPNGELQRFQVVQPESWEGLSFLQPSASPDALDCYARIYRKYLVPACPWLFGNMVLFRLPEDLELPLPMSSGRYGCVADRLTAAAALIRDEIRFLGGKPYFRSEAAGYLWRELEERDCVRLVRGRLPVTTPIPVNSLSGYLSRTEPDAALKVNASFFIMDRFDCATVYDHVGTPIGLCVTDGRIINPPLFDREALLVDRDGNVRVRHVKLEDLRLEIRGKSYHPGKDALVYSRPDRNRTPRSGLKKLVIVDCRVAAVVTAPSASIPASGFVLCVSPDTQAEPGDPVTYRGMEHIRFGIQVGNSVIVDGEKTEHFRSRFYNIRHFQRVPFPPSLYPMNFRKARAARIVLGADREGKPMLIWAEGAGKNRYLPGEDSRGASLQEMADICLELGMVNGIHLDGGGSAQILLKNRRSLHTSDRKAEDNSDDERPIPLALMIK